MGTSDTKIFDKDTLLDLTVNFVPLGILLFFTVYIVVASPWSIGDDPLITVVTIALHVIPFVSLAVLTYFSGKAIAGSEKEGDVYLAGRASVSSAAPLETEHDGESDDAHTAEIGEPDADATAAAEGDADEGTAEDMDAVEDDAVTSDDEGETDPEPGSETRDATDGVDEDEDESGDDER